MRAKGLFLLGVGRKLVAQLLRDQAIKRYNWGAKCIAGGFMLRKLCLILIAGVVLVACGANTEINATIEGVELPATWTVTPEDINVVFESPTPDESIALDQHESVATFVAQITAKPTNLPSATIDPAMVDYLTQKALTPTHTDTPVPTLTPSLTPTQVAPLQAHTFVPEDLLIEMTIGCGDGGCDRPFANNPILYLYANGLLVKFPDWDEAPVYTYLSRKEMCRVLNTIDQTGFFDYDDGEYQSPWDGGGGLYFNISTWESNSTALSMFWYFVEIGRAHV